MTARRLALLAVSTAIAASPALAQSITTDAPNNGRSDNGAGVFLNIMPFAAIDITAIDYYASSGAGTQTTVEIWVYPGSYVGNHNDPTGWILHDTISAVSNGTTTPAPLLFNIPLELDGGVTTGIYIVTQNGGIRYTGTGGNPPQMMWQNADLELFSDLARGGPPWQGSVFTPRTFAGTIHYIPGGSPCYANCDNSTTEPVLTVNDFTCFINEFASAQTLPPAQQIEHYANCDGSTTSPVLTVNDFTCFINEFAQGCP